MKKSGNKEKVFISLWAAALAGIAGISVVSAISANTAVNANPPQTILSAPVGLESVSVKNPDGSYTVMQDVSWQGKNGSVYSWQEGDVFGVYMGDEE